MTGRSPNFGRQVGGGLAEGMVASVSVSPKLRDTVAAAARSNAWHLPNRRRLEDSDEYDDAGHGPDHDVYSLRVSAPLRPRREIQ